MWQGIVGHDRVVEQFRRALERQRLATSFLFVGPAGVGKRTFALKLAQVLLCSERPEAAMAPCGHCPSCVQVAAGAHPDLDVVTKPADKSYLPLELLIGDAEHRMREGLCHNIGMKPFMGRRKVAVIDDADYLNAEGANSLLKTLEEPPPRSVLILIGTSPAKQLPTIRSRCQLIRFLPLSPETAADILVARGLIADRGRALRLAEHAGGSLQRAMELTDDALWAFREDLDRVLAAVPLDSPRLAAMTIAFAEAAGKEAPARRARLRQAFAFAVDFYRQGVRLAAGAATAASAADVGQMAAAWPGSAEAAQACLERCLDAARQLDRNVHQTALVEAWADDLANLT